MKHSYINRGFIRPESISISAHSKIFEADKTLSKLSLHDIVFIKTYPD